ncbi:MAG: DUF2793 domain-containing protein [Hyphomonadaceae bacterium]|nr:DUF2793 domain-containing protein [Hyphomonadaceae bacterium]
MAVITTKISESFGGLTIGGLCVVNSMKVYDASQIKVYVDGDENDPAVVNTDYTVTIAGDLSGCTVTTLAPLVARATTITVARVTPLTSDFDITPNGKLSEPRLVEQLDKGLMREQENADDFARALRFPVGDAAAATLPNAADRASTLLAFDATGAIALAVDVADPAVFASQTEAELGLSTTKAMSPFRAAQGRRANSPTVVVAAQTAPPGSPATGAVYAVMASATGAWVGQGGKLAQWDGAAWAFHAVATGSLAWSRTQHAFYIGLSVTWMSGPLEAQAHLYDYLPVGTNPDDVTDWKDALQAAAASGKIVRLPERTLPYGAKFSFTANRVGGGLIGAGYNTVLQPTFATDDFWRVGDDVDGFVGYVFQDFRVWPTVVQNTGKAVGRFYRLTQSVISRVWVGSQEDYATAGAHRIAHGWSFERFAEIVIEGQNQIVVTQDGLRMHGGADGLFGAEILVDRRVRFLHCDTAVRIGGGCGGVYLESLDASLCGNDVVIDKTLAAIANREVFLGGHCVLDVCSSYNLNIEGSSVYLVQLADTWLSANSNAAGALIRIAPETDAIKPLVQMTGGKLRNAQGSAALLSGGRVILNGVEISANGQAGAGGDGIEALNSNVELIVVHCDLRNNGNATKGMGITAVAGVTGYVEGNRFSGNGQGNIDNASASLEVRHNHGIGKTQPINQRWNEDYSGTSQSVASGAEIVLAAGSGYIELTDDTSGAMALFRANAGGVTKVDGSANFVASSTPGATEIGVYFNAGAYRIKNGYPGARPIAVTGRRLRQTV